MLDPRTAHLAKLIKPGFMEALRREVDAVSFHLNPLNGRFNCAGRYVMPKAPSDGA